MPAPRGLQVPVGVPVAVLQAAIPAVAPATQLELAYRSAVSDQPFYDMLATAEANNMKAASRRLLTMTLYELTTGLTVGYHVYTY